MSVCELSHGAGSYSPSRPRIPVTPRRSVTDAKQSYGCMDGRLPRIDVPGDNGEVHAVPL